MPTTALVLRAPGTNCDAETAFALEKAGAVCERLHIMRLIDDPGRLDQAQILVIPGGFSFGDDLAAGRVFAARLTALLGDRLRQFADRGGLILGICNGFQVLLRTGLLEPAVATATVRTVETSSEPHRAASDLTPAATLTWNTSGRYVDRWVHLKTTPGHRCVFLTGIEYLEMPIAHAEGRFVFRDEATLAAMETAGQLPLRYTDPMPSTGTSTVAGGGHALASNPNGSMANVAGLCDPTGRVFGLMPHPERYLDRLHHPRWTRGEGRDPGDGFQLFVNAVTFFA